MHLDMTKVHQDVCIFNKACAERAATGPTGREWDIAF